MDAEDQNRFLLFRMGDESYGTPLLEVREVVEYQKPKFVPNTHAHFVGVINVRGSIVGVVDLRLRLNLGPKQPGSALLICDTPSGPIAAVVDKIDAVASIEDSEIERNPPVKSKVDSSSFCGIAKHRGELVTMINLNKLLTETPLTKSVA